MKVLAVLAVTLLACSGVQSLSCMGCDSTTCDVPTDCKGGLTLDVCGCCKVCAKVEGEVCGGPWKTLGKCDTGLECIYQGPKRLVHFEQRQGVCRAGPATSPPIDVLKGVRPGKTEDKATNGCPTPLVYCILDPCQGATCPAVPTAVCKADFCGGCNAKFYNKDGQHVDCNAKTAKRIPINMKPNKGCVHNGVAYNVGESFKIDCNNCFCTKSGGAACTKMACRPLKPRPIGPQDSGCQYKDKNYQTGESFKDDCNNCRCGSRGMVSCTKMFCLPTFNDRFGHLFRLIGGSVKCSYNGKTYTQGQQFKGDNGNNCVCMTRGRSNRRPTVRCATTPIPRPINPDCLAPMKTGHCRAAMPRFGYNSETGTCEQFTYGGCGGNTNNFRNKAECMRKCGVPKEGRRSQRRNRTN